MAMRAFANNKIMTIKNELKVGFLVLGTGVLAVFFAWLLGVQNPFRRSIVFYVTYNFAGGVEVGSPVRVSGIKVGRVENIDFFVPSDQKNPVALKEPGSAESSEETNVHPVRLRVSVMENAARGIKHDSRFYINLAGIIGERYIEVTPGTLGSPLVRPGDTLAGVDPPRIDQLISQSFDLAGKLSKVIEDNKGDFSKTLELLYKLSGNLNRTVAAIDQSKFFKTDVAKLVDNLVKITSDVKLITEKIETPEGKKTLELLHRLLWRLEPLDSKKIQKFLQEDGIRARIF